MFNKFIQKASDLVTAQEQTRAGFLSIALEKNRVSDPYVKNALAFRSMVADTRGPEDFLHLPAVRPFVLTAAGLSEKSMKYLDDADQTAAIRELIEKFLKPAGRDYIDETIYRYLLIKGDAVGGTMRNRIGALGEEKLIRAILSAMHVSAVTYDWMANIPSYPWSPMQADDMDIEKNLKALHWRTDRGDRVLGLNLNIPIVRKNVDLCLFACDMNQYNKGKIVKTTDKILMLGELKGGIDPAGADEHWKTANTALGRIRASFSSAGCEIQTSFVGAAIEHAMAEEIFTQLQNGMLSNAANLTDSDQLTEYCSWILSI